MGEFFANGEGNGCGRGVGSISGNDGYGAADGGVIFNGEFQFVWVGFINNASAVDVVHGCFVRDVVAFAVGVDVVKGAGYFVATIDFAVVKDELEFIEGAVFGCQGDDFGKFAHFLAAVEEFHAKGGGALWHANFERAREWAQAFFVEFIGKASVGNDKGFGVFTVTVVDGGSANAVAFVVDAFNNDGVFGAWIVATVKGYVK